jgi:hypothetical protein
MELTLGFPAMYEELNGQLEELRTALPKPLTLSAGGVLAAIDKYAPVCTVPSRLRGFRASVVLKEKYSAYSMLTQGASPMGRMPLRLPASLLFLIASPATRANSYVCSSAAREAYQGPSALSRPIARGKAAQDQHQGL